MTETEQPEAILEEALEPRPFLRIVATYPAEGGRVETVEMQLNPGQEDLVTPGSDDGQVDLWFTNFVTCVISALRRGSVPPTVVMTGNAMKVLAERMRHAEGCDGSCGQPLPTVDPPPDPRDANGHTDQRDGA